MIMKKWEKPIEPTKPSPSAAAQIETDITSPIAAVPTVVKKVPVFPSAKDPFSLSSIYVPRKPPPVTTGYIHTAVNISAI